MGAIPAALIPQVFEPLTGGQRRRDRSRGLGLGLFISKRIVVAHGGDVEVSSSEAEGTTFTVSLPRFADDAAAQVEPHDGRRRRSAPRRRRARRARADQPGRPRARAAARERGAVPPAGRGGEGLRDLHARSERPGRHLERRARSGSRATTPGEIIGQHFSQFYEAEDVRRRQVRARAGGRGARRTVRGRGLAPPQGRHAVLGERGHHGAARRERRAGRVRQGDARSHRTAPAGAGAARLGQGRGGDPAARRVPVAGGARAEDAAHGAADAARHAAATAWTSPDSGSRPSCSAPRRAASGSRTWSNRCSTSRASRPAASR